MRPRHLSSAARARVRPATLAIALLSALPAALEAMDLFSGRQLRWAFSVVQEQRAMMRAVARGGTVPPPDTLSRELPIPIIPAAPPPPPLVQSGRTPCVDSC